MTWGVRQRGGEAVITFVICRRPHEDPSPEDPWMEGPTYSCDPITPLSQSCLALARPHISWLLEGEGACVCSDWARLWWAVGTGVQVWPDPCGSPGDSLLPEETLAPS